jgi:hypothetical protein
MAEVDDKLHDIKSRLFGGDEVGMNQLNELFNNITLSDVDITKLDNPECRRHLSGKEGVVDILTQPRVNSYLNSFVIQEKYRLLDRTIKMFRDEDTGPAEAVDEQIQALKKNSGVETGVSFWDTLRRLGGITVEKGCKIECDSFLDKNNSYMQTCNILNSLENDEVHEQKIIDGWKPFINYVCNYVIPNFLLVHYYRLSFNPIVLFGDGEYSFNNIVEEYKQNCDRTLFGHNHENVVRDVVDYMKNTLIPQLEEIDDDKLSTQEFRDEVLQTIWREYIKHNKVDIEKNIDNNTHLLRKKVFYQIFFSDGDGWERYMNTPNTKKLDTCVDSFISDTSMINSHVFPAGVSGLINTSPASRELFIQNLDQINKREERMKQSLFPTSPKIVEESGSKTEEGDGMDFDTFIAGLNFNMDSGTVPAKPKKKQRVEDDPEKVPANEPSCNSFVLEEADNVFYLIDKLVLETFMAKLRITDKTGNFSQAEWACITNLLTSNNILDQGKNPLLTCMYFILYKWLLSS